MNNDDLIEKARAFAYQKHTGQVDKAGHPYTEHLEAVAAKLTNPVEKTVAYLHDTLEDTDCTVAELASLFPAEIVQAVQAMTRPKDPHDYLDYVRKIKENPIARQVKQADLMNNMDLTRLPNPTAEDFRRVEKYKAAYAILTGN